MAADIITLQEVGRMVGLGDGAHDRWIIAVGNPHEKRRCSVGNLWETLGKHTINEGFLWQNRRSKHWIFQHAMFDGTRA